MKKLSIYLVLVLVCAGMVMFNSCEKENGLTQQVEKIELNDNILIDNGVLTFSTVAVYDETIKALGLMTQEELDQWEIAYSHNSLRSSKKNQKLTDEIGNTFATLLNVDSEIIIAGNYFKLNSDDKTAVTYVIDQDSNCELKSSSDNDITILDFDDDIEIFQNGIQLKSTAKCSNNETDWQVLNGLDVGHAKYKISYQKYIVYSCLKARIIPYDATGITVWIYDTNGTPTYFLKNADEDCPTRDVFWGTRIDEELYDIVYDGGTKLIAYDVNLTFKAQRGSSISFESNSLSCHDNLINPCN